MPSFEVSGSPSEPVERRRLADELTVRILEHIRDQGLRPGDRLPATRVLAQRFAVATPTLREALRRLEATGALELRHGSGVYVRGEQGRLIFTNPNRLRLDRSAILDLIAARELIEPHLAEGAAHLAGKDDARLARLATSLERAAQALGDGTGPATAVDAGPRASRGGKRHAAGGNADAPPADDAELHAANMDFHREIGRLGGNRALAQVLDSLLDIYDQEQRYILALYGDRDQDLQTHQSILAAIIAGKPVRARRLMREHLRDVRTVVGASLDAPDLS